MRYETDDRKAIVYVHHYPVDGSQITIHKWSKKDQMWVTKYDYRIIADSFYEAMCSALVVALGVDWEMADWQCAEWGIAQPEWEDD